MASGVVDLSPLLIPQSLGKHPREDEPPEQKRAKSRRRKQKVSMDASMSVDEELLQQQWYQNGHVTGGQPVVPQPPRNSRRTVESDNLTPEEAEKRERIRASARERQRKHRALVKERKMKALGLEGGSEIEAQQDNDEYRPLNPEHPLQQYHQMLQETAPPQSHTEGLMYSPPSTTIQLQNEQGQPVNGGQMFATTLLLSFSCAPLLKQHLLDSLRMTNDELASLEPLIAGAWEQWNAQRQNRYEPPQQPFNQSTTPSISESSSSAGSTTNNRKSLVAEEFRARFSRSIGTPTPYQAVSSPSPSSTVIDPTLAEQTDP
ncbi:hypothetical protein V5O48_005889 [Marasmius crinis-equi]|uniref:BZIP domain-containing protein n=1 Tax=Marasmius crinis-equi TaxID=585013 RepID=A0ABR3FLJ2_9AGAR